MPTSPVGGRLVLLTGLQASGKTTIANLLATDHGYAIISSDIFRSEGPSHSLWQRMAGAASDELKRGRTVVIDATNYSHSHRQRFIAVSDQLDCPYLIVYLKARLKTLIERNTSRDESIPSGAIVRMSRVFEPPVGTDVLEIDTEIVKPQQAASVVVKTLALLTRPGRECTTGNTI